MKDCKTITSDLKRIYHLVTEQEASLELDRFAEKCDDKYQQISKSWRSPLGELNYNFLIIQQI